MTDVVSVERVIPVSADKIFALISDPSRHHEFDGSGTVQQARNVPDKLALGATFGMHMRMGVPYAMRSTVVEYEQDRRLAWQTRAPIKLVDPFAGGRIWRYELEPVEGGTKVTESWDISQESPVTKPMVRRAANATRRNMTRTLERIEEVLTKQGLSA
ncbi:MAG: SRPBCC family protein [Mycobacteriales bacterium]